MHRALSATKPLSKGLSTDLKSKLKPTPKISIFTAIFARICALYTVFLRLSNTLDRRASSRSARAIPPSKNGNTTLSSPKWRRRLKRSKKSLKQIRMMPRKRPNLMSFPRKSTTISWKMQNLWSSATPTTSTIAIYTGSCCLRTESSTTQLCNSSFRSATPRFAHSHCSGLVARLYLARSTTWLSTSLKLPRKKQKL